MWPSLNCDGRSIDLRQVALFLCCLLGKNRKEINLVVTRPSLGQLTFRKEKMEGDFRYKHVFIRTNAESLAFCGTEAEEVEHKDLDGQLLSLCRTQQDLVTRQFLLDLSTNTFDYFGSIARSGH